MTAPAVPAEKPAPASAAAPLERRRFLRSTAALVLGVCVVVLLAAVSLFVGVGDLSLSSLMSGDPTTHMLFWVSQLPRTLSIVLAGMALSVAGLIMQLMARNKFVEPSTVGTVESAQLGILAVTVLLPGASMFLKMSTASVFAAAGTALFLLILRRIPLRNTLIVPLVGIMLGGVISAVTTFFAYRTDLLQTLNSWMIGDFSGVLRGRYELLWIVGALTLIGYLAADRFTVAGMGQDFTTNLGLNYNRVMALGLVIVSLISAVVVVSVGSIPFLGLIVPNLVSLLIGDNVRRAVPWVAVFGAGFVLLCDIIGRTIRYPYEIPVGVVVSAVGSVIFLYLLLRKRGSHA
ncbi:iron chelate uptake ABC transporter family permease subunit [Arthrobacter sp. zg-Y859]|uniref:Iron chelate uptake ABC transporter family permease subunit n=1 Tax=Arthrobacter jinronghuae TaxID=2964609 RepID=A0ABT1NNX3_9MICC|nr:iron chelate uptake ABC transporter family permease subunit [Arthrobacter jinronghuae]MCQ1949335.1 iron chelate uptake ABC transporter family permease subunit [Arthrobacter jinronghuae]UWX77886.1 iron chelate uptake ABC transporter family permease subunit [Arthrobacter jinronghuae]